MNVIYFQLFCTAITSISTRPFFGNYLTAMHTLAGYSPSNDFA